MSKMTHRGIVLRYFHGAVLSKYEIFLRETPKFWISSGGSRFKKHGSMKGWGSGGRKLDMDTIKRIEVTE